ncbi:MAG TPA: Sb-PDE family phosphodiesterase [Vicinamibacteria bacterium]|nr:Sb-PDE family phosphodiesterase [Vicinamibacteria bacterium]
MAGLVVALFGGTGAAHDVRVRRPLRVPDIPGYRTLQCDFHTHTVFSDGSVWPDVRAEEAWREGLDAIAITDHIEYQPHKDDLPTSHERSYEIAQPHGDQLGLLVIRGSEVTRDMPPGHINAIFLSSVTPLDTPDWRQALRAAREQGAFAFWNHPGWTGQQPDGVARWYPEHDEIVKAGLLQGIEVVNERSYYPEAHRWSLEKNLTPLANSDIHAPLNLDYHVHEGDHRPVTLVFARERSAEAIREALFARRTAAWSGSMLVGREELLRPLVEAAITLENPRLRITAGGSAYLRIRNDSDLRLELSFGGPTGALTAPKSVVVAAMGTSLLPIRAPREAATGPVKLDLAYTITNLKIAPDTGLRFPVVVDVEVLPARE